MTSQHYRQWPLISLLLGFVLFTHICFTPAPAWAWGQRSYSEELPLYKAQKENYQRQRHQLDSRMAGVQNQLQAFWAAWSQEDRNKAYQWFENNAPNARAFKSRFYSSKAEFDKSLVRYQEQYDQLITVDIAAEGLGNRQARDILWSAELETLRLQNAAMADELRYRELGLAYVKKYEGIYWTDFVNDTLDDMQYVLKDYVSNLTNELYNCFLDTAASYSKDKMLGRPLPRFGAGFGQVSWGSKVFDCAKGITLNAIVNALEAAVRKQFVDSMEDKGIERAVAEFWWSQYVMPKAANQTRTQQAFKKFISVKFLKGQVKDEAKRYLLQQLAKDIKPDLIKRLKTLASQERYGDRAKKLVDAVSKDRAAQHTAMQFLEAAEFTISYGERALLLYYNQAGFESIALDLMQKYRTIKECLGEKKKPAHASAIISVFKYSPAGWRDFLRDCRKADSAKNPLSDSWSWRVDCGGTIFTGSFSIGQVAKDGSFSGSFGGTHSGTLKGTLTGNSFTFTRTFSRSQTWTGTLTGKTIQGTLSDPFHPKMKLPATCSFTATR